MKYIAVVCRPGVDVGRDDGGAYSFIGENREDVIERALLFYHKTMKAAQRYSVKMNYQILLGEITDEIQPLAKYMLKSLRA